MDVQGQRRDPPDGLDDGDSDGEIGHEQAVHHVHMDVVGSGRAQGTDVALEIDEICRENGRRYLDHVAAS